MGIGLLLVRVPFALEQAGLIHREIRGREHWLSIRPEQLDRKLRTPTSQRSGARPGRRAARDA
jgi:hypothetical protein